MITVTLTFTSIDAAVRALREIPESALASAPVAVPVVKDDPAPKPAKASKTAAEPVAAQARPTAERTEDPAPAAAAAPAETAASVDYPTLQRAVFALAGKSREAAVAVAQSFGVRTFKDLPADKWADALAAVNAKLAELEGA